MDNLAKTDLPAQHLRNYESIECKQELLVASNFVRKGVSNRDELGGLASRLG
jgi:hypothetical protein